MYLVDDEGEEYVLRPDEVLHPHSSTRIPYQHFDIDGQSINLVEAFFTDAIKKHVRVNDVTITFDMSGVQWRRTGNGESVRVIQPALGTE